MQIKFFGLWCIGLGLGIAACNSQPVRQPLVSPKENRQSQTRLVDSVWSIYKPYLTDTNKAIRLSGVIAADPRAIKLATAKALKNAKHNSDKEKIAFEEEKALQLNTELFNYAVFKTLKKAPIDTSQKYMFYLSTLAMSRFVPLQDIKKLYASFSPQARDSKLGKMTWSEIAKSENSFKHNLGLNFNTFEKETLIDSHLKKQPFSALLKGNQTYTIIVFGASWCVPCRYSERLLLQWWPQLDSNQVKIKGISVDEDTNSWRKSITDDKIKWDCYLVPGAFKSALVKKLDFTGIPRVFLLNSDGKVVAEHWDLTKILESIPVIEFVKQ